MNKGVLGLLILTLALAACAPTSSDTGQAQQALVTFFVFRVPRPRDRRRAVQDHGSAGVRSISIGHIS